MKIVKILFAVLLAAIVAGGLVIFLGLQNLDRIVKEIVEEAGPEVVGTPVSLGSASISLKDGRAELTNLTIANPPGYSDAQALSLGQIVAAIEPASLTRDVVVIEEVSIRGTRLLAELKGLQESNLKAIMDNVKSSTGGGRQPEPQETESDVRLAVKQFNFEDSSLRLVSDQFGEKTLTIPGVRLRDLGTPERGLKPEELAEAAIEPLLAAAREAVQDYVEDAAKGKAEEAIKRKLSEKLGADGEEQLDKLKSLFK